MGTRPPVKGRPRRALVFFGLFGIRVIVTSFNISCRAYLLVGGFFYFVVYVVELFGSSCKLMRTTIVIICGLLSVSSSFMLWGIIAYLVFIVNI